MSEVRTLTPGQRRTFAAREALARKFSSPEEKQQFYREVGERGNAGRAVLRADDAAALRQAYALLSEIVERLPKDDERSTSAA